MSTPPLKDRILEDSRGALKAGDKARLGVLRLILAEIKQREVDERILLDDGRVLGLLEKMVKQRRDVIPQYQQAGREDLAQKEAFEIEVISAYQPARLEEAELEAHIEAAIATAGATSVRELGKVMAALKERVQGRADLGSLSARVRAKLGP